MGVVCSEPQAGAFSEARAKLMSEANGVLVDSITNASLVKNFSNFLYEKRHYFSYVRRAAAADRLETCALGICLSLRVFCAR